MEIYFPNKPRMMMAAGLLYLLALVLLLNVVIKVNATVNVNITLLESAVPNGAVCLDGSPPAYSFYEGFGDGAENWIVYLEGGGWCFSTDNCVEKSKKNSGSSRQTFLTYTTFSGLLDDDCQFNPEFCRWNKVFFHYCDGSSFSSNVDVPDPRTNITYRGSRIFYALIEEMKTKGLVNADKAILAGSSAGGLATILHCDIFRALIPNANKLKCLSDSGFFIRGDKVGLPGIELREVGFAHDVVQTHQLATVLPNSCTSHRNPDLCLFPEYLVEDIVTPLFILESAFDYYQVTTNLLPAVASGPEIRNCTDNIVSCNTTLLSIMKDFRGAFIETLMKLNKSPSRGMFVHSCIRHVHIVSRDGWTCSCVQNNVLANKTIGEAVREWYFDDIPFHQIELHKDSPFNCTIDTETTDPYFDQECLSKINHS